MADPKETNKMIGYIKGVNWTFAKTSAKTTPHYNFNNILMFLRT